MLATLDSKYLDIQTETTKPKTIWNMGKLQATSSSTTIWESHWSLIAKFQVPASLLIQPFDSSAHSQYHG